MGAKERILRFLKSQVGKLVLRKDIVAAAGTVEWARRVRELRAAGWRIKTTAAGYQLQSLKRGQAQDTAGISEKIRYAILHRDTRCRRCGAQPDDGVKLVVDHIVPRAWGGVTTVENLWALCERCNRGKKHFQNDAEAAAMKKVLALRSGLSRLREYFRIRVGKVVSKEELIIVSGIHDHPRRIRELREEGWDIASFYENPKLRPGDYVLRHRSKRNRR